MMEESGSEKKEVVFPSTLLTLVVHPPELRTTSFTKYHVFKITSSPSVVDHVYRRFNDFVWLSSLLATQFPCLFIPPLPPKQVFGNMGDEFVHERRLSLERFINRVAAIPILADSAAFQMFVSRAFTFDEGMKEIEKEVKGLSIPIMTKTIQQFYPEITEMPVPQNGDQEIKVMLEFLINEEEGLNSFLKESKEFVANMSKNVLILGKMNAAMSHLFTLEKAYGGASDEHSRYNVLENFTQLHTDWKEADPSYTSELVVTLGNELMDVQALIAVLKKRNAAQLQYTKTTKPKADKWSAKDAMTDPEKVQKQKDIQTEEEERVWCELFTVMLLNAQFKAMWMEKIADWKKSMVRLGNSHFVMASKSAQNFQTMKDGTEH